jgi:hypothetical protein
MDDASAAASTLQRYQQLASEMPEAMQLKQRAQMMSATPVPNQTGLPDQLKAGIESLSGMSMGHVQVHYNSDKPAQLQAHAYAQGSEIHVAPGQERHLPHEAWHVVQQAQGRVRPTAQMKGNVPVNDDAGLETEADVMGGRALAHGAALGTGSKHQEPSQLSATSTVQLAGHPEDLCFVGKWLVKRADSIEIAQYLGREVPPTAPLFDGPFYTAQKALEFLHGAGENVGSEQLNKINLMAATMEPGGKGFMMLGNATTGMIIPKMRDLKMGKHTADDADQERHGVTDFDKEYKLGRHAGMDMFSGSSERGYRDEDRWKSSKFGDNLDELRPMLDRAHLAALMRILNDLATFKAWLVTTNVIYVGMSLLLVAGEDQGKAVAIDFEHPVWDTEKSFQNHQQGLLVGVNNLLALVQDYLDTFEARAKRAEAERNVRAAADRQTRIDSLVANGGSINNTDEGNSAIGDYDL